MTPKLDVLRFDLRSCKIGGVVDGHKNARSPDIVALMSEFGASGPDLAGSGQTNPFRDSCAAGCAIVTATRHVNTITRKHGMTSNLSKEVYQSATEMRIREPSHGAFRSWT